MDIHFRRSYGWRAPGLVYRVCMSLFMLMTKKKVDFRHVLYSLLILRCYVINSIYF